ncbi:PREDICTED: protein Brevis radix-like 4 isoform X2 [Tarenaya hassleriana]|uniref:protein Brevis radix-like 4 isoform X2 n=1 Tax=Tarenaya hassleriana TaxID=28532 RepID=UPI00053C1814|nr:PREDICTED: protein Brevis radix-like 4 isoform X2 [Tarenaya hassleriana]
MLTCIARPKKAGEDSPGQPDDPDSKNIKSLTSQLKDMALKASGAYRHCTPCTAGQGRIRNPTWSDTDSDRFRMSYRRTNSSSSSSATASTPRVWGKEMEARLKGISSGEATPKSASGRNRLDPIVFVEEKEPKEWVAQVEPGVLITFVSLPGGGNDLKRIRFSRDMFNKLQAQRWWADNYDKVMELYNVKRLNRQACPLPAPPRSEDENAKLEYTEESPATPPLNGERLPRNMHHPTGISGAKMETSSMDASIRSSSSREADRSEDMSISNASDLENEWVEQDEPGVYITIRSLPGGKKELRRVRFSRERFGEVHARLWWEENRARIHELYL